ncbi:unnamed protein product [Zymoseptoria tritici ST99CH_3D1]|nr:unnamed protein product [Zymoseptoria tritici ST99CH_3D1]
MPTELEELVEFLHHGNTEIRQIAAENLVGYSTAQPSLFKYNDSEPVRDLKLLIKDYPPIAKNALTILINISEDTAVVEALISDDAFMEALLKRISDAKEPHADLQCMLLANLSKSDKIPSLLTLSRPIPKPLSTSPLAIDQLLDCFVKGASNSYNPNATYDYLSYLFADMAKHESGRKHFLTPRPESGAAQTTSTSTSTTTSESSEQVLPLSKLTVFTTHPTSPIRRRGVASTIKNICFDIPSHPTLLSPSEEGGLDLLPYILLPLMGPEEYSDEDTDALPEACQLLPPDKEREGQNDIIVIHLETLLLLTTTAEGRKELRGKGVYAVIRALHEQVEEEGVREGCDRLVQVLMRGEEGDEGYEAPTMPSGMKALEEAKKVTEVEEDQEEQIVDVL